MANGALVIRWSTAVPGREAKALEVFGEAIAHFDALAKSGRIHGHTEYLSVTGKTGGFMVVEGDLATLAAIQTEESQLTLLDKSATIVQDFEVQLYEGGNEATVGASVQRYAGALTELGYM